MTNVEKIEKDIKALSADEFRALETWFDAHRADVWDKQIASDLETGKLDSLLAEAKAEIQADKAKPI